LREKEKTFLEYHLKFLKIFCLFNCTIEIDKFRWKTNTLFPLFKLYI